MDFYQNYVPDSATLSKICLISSSIIKATTKSGAGSSKIGGSVNFDCWFWISDCGADWVELGFGFLGAADSVGGFVDSSFGRLDSDSVFDVFFEAGKKILNYKRLYGFSEFFFQKNSLEPKVWIF